MSKLQDFFDMSVTVGSQVLIFFMSVLKATPIYPCQKGNGMLRNERLPLLATQGMETTAKAMLLHDDAFHALVLDIYNI